MMFRNMVTSLLDKERIRTTLPRAKAIRPIAERMITLGKRESLHARRQALAFIKDPAWLPSCSPPSPRASPSGTGGYTRIIRLGFRDGDGAQMAYLELLGSEFKPAKKEEGKGERKGSRRKQWKEEKQRARRRKSDESNKKSPAHPERLHSCSTI